MTKLRVRAYEPEDFLDIEIMNYERACRENMPLAAWAMFKKEAGPAVTVVDPQEQIVAMAGIHNMWPGVGELWAVFSLLARHYPHIWIVSRQVFNSWKVSYHRLQAALDPVNCPEAIRFDERLGMRPEGLMRKYGPHGEDRVMYAWVRCD